MSEINTREFDNNRSFEERVFARFDGIDQRMDSMEVRFDARFETIDRRFDNVDGAVRNLDSRVEKVEIRAYDTKPIWEQVLKEIVDTRRDLSKRLDRIEAIVFETRADLREAEDRIERLEDNSKH